MISIQVQEVRFAQEVEEQTTPSSLKSRLSNLRCSLHVEISAGRITILNL